ncbi:ABC transporter substrate-binding protein [Agromyces albus]|nr:ABC transporter substrate-binding protein [Agromyces albus]
MPMTNKRRLSVLAAAAVAVLALSACTGQDGSSGGGDDQGPRTLKLGVSSELLSYDPVDLNGGGEGNLLWMPVYDRLLTITPDNGLEPGLATEWAFDDSFSVLTLELRDGVTFSDGAPFTAETVKANIENLKASSSTEAGIVAPIEEVVPVDENTVEFHLASYDPTLLYQLGLAAGVMASPEALGTEEIKLNPVGSGPYTLDDQGSVRGSELIYVKNDEHWNSDAYPYETLVFKTYQDITARLNAAKSGEVDGAPITSAAAAEAEAAGLTITNTPAGWLGLGLFDRAGQIAPELADVRVRQAINYAFDKQAILENVEQGYGYATSQTFAEGQPGYDPELDNRYEYDPEKARELLAEAGYPDGFDLTIPDLPHMAAYTPIIADQLKDVGINVTIKPVAPTDTLAEMFGGQNAAFAMEFGGTSIGQITALSTQSVWNIFKSTDEELSQLVSVAYKATEEDEQDKTYREVNRWVVDNAWFAPWYMKDSIFVTSSEVTVEPWVTNVTPLISSFAPAK